MVQVLISGEAASPDVFISSEILCTHGVILWCHGGICSLQTVKDVDATPFECCDLFLFWYKVFG